MEVKRNSLQIGSWQTMSSTNSLSLPKQAKSKAFEVINNYAQNFPEEAVWVQENHQVPSLILSMNCVFRGDFSVYSISQNPKNLGLAVMLNLELKTELEKVKSSWPKIYATTHPQFQDDYLWIETLDISEAANKPGLLLIRNPEFNFNPEYFSGRSVNSILRRNSNAYGEALNLWTRVNAGYAEELPWQKGFALKPLTRVKSQFNLYHSRQGPGLISESRVESLIDNRSFFLQKFINPMDSPITGEKMVFKIYFAYDVVKKEYRYLGGLWLSRANYRIHGTPETTFGKLI